MIRYISLRVLLAVAVLWAAYTVTFGILFVIPGDPVSAMAAGGLDGSPLGQEQLDELRARYGYDRPLLEQYAEHLFAAIRGDLGSSVQTGQPVSEAIGAVLSSTVELSIAALVLAVVLGGGIALLATYTRIHWLCQGLLALPPLTISIPTFWIGLLLIQWFSFQWGLLPAMGHDGWQHLVLPAITLALPISALIAQVLARSLLEAAQQPYIVTAKAKGISALKVHLGHVLGNAILPALAMLGLIAGNLLSGSVIVETVFSRPGVGQLSVQAVSAQDLPVVQGVVLLGAVVFIASNLLVDLLLPVADPRLSLGRRYA